MKTLFISLFSMIMISATMAQNQVLPLWEGDPPNYRDTGEETIIENRDILVVSNVQKPEIAVYLPAKRNATGEAVVICPGGGYHVLAYDWEGIDIASWLNSKGIAAIVLTYRLPDASCNIVPYKSPLMDAQRALRTVRANAEKWNVDPAKIGVMGFSAGGHLASTLSTHFDAGDPASKDPVEQVSCRPDFSILMYPVISFSDEITHAGSKQNLLGENPDPKLVEYFSNELQVTEDTPPAILIHSADDDAVPVENSIAYFNAIMKYSDLSELHIYPYGGHGYSLAIGMGHLSSWPDRVIDWISYLNKQE